MRQIEIRNQPLIRTLLLTATVSCGAGPEEAPGFSLDTLASGRVVARNTPTPVQDLGWRLEPRIRIGTADGDGAASFGRVLDIAIGPDQLVYVLDGLAAEVRVFDLDGRHVRTIGGPGDGPGELRLPYAIAFDYGGRLWVPDERQRSYSVFDSAGAFIRTFRRPIRWPVTSGELNFTSPGVLQEAGWWGSGPGGVIRMRVGDEIAIEDTVPLPRFDLPLFSHPNRVGLGIAVPFAPRQVAAVGPSDAVWTGRGDVYRIARILSSGDTARVIELAVRPAALSTTEKSAARDTVEMARTQRLDVDESRVPAAHPLFTSIVIADNGDIWVRRPAEEARPTASGGRGALFDVFNAVGRYLGSVPAPVAEWPSPHIANGFLVGVTRDELGVDYVDVYRIVRT